MKIPRIYDGEDGQAHIEEIDVDSFPNPQSLTEITGLQFRVQQPGRFADWHVESRRNYIITLSGEGEIGLGDGSLHRFGPGAVVLVEDLTGQGHTTRVTSDIPRVTIAVPLANQTPGT